MGFLVAPRESTGYLDVFVGVIHGPWLPWANPRSTSWEIDITRHHNGSGLGSIPSQLLLQSTAAATTPKTLLQGSKKFPALKWFQCWLYSSAVDVPWWKAAEPLLASCSAAKVATVEAKATGFWQGPMTWDASSRQWETLVFQSCFFSGECVSLGFLKRIQVFSHDEEFFTVEVSTYGMNMNEQWTLRVYGWFPY